MQRTHIAVMRMGGRGDLDAFGAGTILGSILILTFVGKANSAFPIDRRPSRLNHSE
jgi:hypothetical protein